MKLMHESLELKPDSCYLKHLILAVFQMLLGITIVLAGSADGCVFLFLPSFAGLTPLSMVKVG